MVSEKIKLFWEKCGTNYAHLVETGWRKKSKYFDGYKFILKNLPFSLKNKTILDYGCGGGFLGELLFDYYFIKRYVGIDISKRSIEYAEKRLEKYNTKFFLLPIDLKVLKDVDVLFSFACFQHFESEIILIDVLKNINDSSIKYVCLQVKYKEKEKFRNEYLKKNGNIGICCQINNNYILKYLTNYKLVYSSKIKKYISSQDLVYETN